MKNPDKVKEGKKGRAMGKRFENKVREDLEFKGWIVTKWQNKVEWSENNINLPPEKRTGKLVACKPKFNPFTRSLMMISGGFPDYLAYKRLNDNEVSKKDINESDFGLYGKLRMYPIIGIESKSKGYLTQEEKEMCQWYLENNVFGKILIAKKGKKRGELIYEEFKD